MRETCERSVKRQVSVRFKTFMKLVQETLYSSPEAHLIPFPELVS